MTINFESFSYFFGGLIQNAYFEGVKYYRFTHFDKRYNKIRNMRKRFEQQLSIGQTPIAETSVCLKSKNKMSELIMALKTIYCNKEYSEQIFSILENHITSKKKKTGRKGMDLWIIFVLSQVRHCLNINYHEVHDLANNHITLRTLMGVHYITDYCKIQFEYQNIYDNISLLDDEVVKQINEVIVKFGHSEVFKKKEKYALHLKTDSFVVESNVHFPTDYNLLWDSARKGLDTVAKILEKHEGIKGWRKLRDWRKSMKGLMRKMGKASASGGKNKEQRMKTAAGEYIVKAKALANKIKESHKGFPMEDKTDFSLHLLLDEYVRLLNKHIDLVERRIIKGEKIPHDEKLFSIFEQHTEWINKGKTRPSVELGKKSCITTDQNNLIVDYMMMTKQQDKDVVIEIADRILGSYEVRSWSYDKGFWSKENKSLLELEIDQVIMPKLGRRSQSEKEEESTVTYRRLKNKHSAIESNINELEHRGLDRCPDRGLPNFLRYIGLAVSAYNLKKIGRELLKQEREKAKQEELKQRRAA